MRSAPTLTMVRIPENNNTATRSDRDRHTIQRKSGTIVAKSPIVHPRASRGPGKLDTAAFTV